MVEIICLMTVAVIRKWAITVVLSFKIIKWLDLFMKAVLVIKYMENNCNLN